MRQIGGMLYRRRRLVLATLFGVAVLLGLWLVIVRLTETLAPVLQALG